MPEQESKVWNPKFRRRKKWQGATWTPPSQSAAVGDGLWCKRCKQRHGYKTMIFRLEIHPERGNSILWSCPRSGNVLKVVKLGG